ncbi:MAG: hypothetical protein KIT09_17060 [Bryobacteraceae bacterium]|nr:hypothetical protein [Bryobacteraceae bacterium]
MPKLYRAFPALLLATCPGLFAQKPVIYPNGVVNAASYSRSVKGEALVVGGAIFSIFGENLAASEQEAPGTPLPIVLGGTSVTVAGIDAPLFYVSPGQINFQAPNAISRRVGERVPVVVATAAGASDPVLAFVQQDAAGIFSQGEGGCGQGVVQNVAADGSVSLNTPLNSASPGSYVVIYGTGMGPLYSPPEDGHPAGTDPFTGVLFPAIDLGIEGFRFHLNGPVSWSGLTPGLVGVHQVNVRLDDDAFEGCAVPVRLTSRVIGSGPPATISIRKGGGPCQDAPKVSFANVGWRKMITTSDDSPSGVAEERFTASFSSAPENLAVPFPDPADPPSRGCPCGGLPVRYASRCKLAGLTALDAGALRLEGVPGGPLTVLPSPSIGEASYGMPLPPGSLEGGTLRVTAAGGAGVGGFDTDVTVPAPIEVTTPLTPGTVIDIRRPFSVDWSGGSPDAVVQMQLIAYHDPEGILGAACTCQVLASEGTVELGMGQNLEGEVLLRIFNRSENAEVVLTVSPRMSKLTRVSAPGLTREGRHEWSYEYRFKGLKIR